VLALRHLTPILALALALSCSSGERPPPLDDLEGAGGAAGDAGDAGEAGAATSGSIVSIAPLSAWEAETHLAIAPGGEAFAVWIGLGLGGGRVVGYATSPDAGRTWNSAGVVPADPGLAAVDPSVAVDASGAFHVAWLELPPAGSPRRVMTARYLGENSFTIPVAVSEPSAPGDLDKPWLASVDGGGLLLVYGSENGSTITAATSDDGALWKPSTIAPDGTLRNVAFPCTSGAQAHVVYLVPGGVEVVSRSGPSAPWSAPTRVDAPSGGAAFEPPSCVARGDDVWVAYGTGGGSGSALETPLLDDVWVAHVTGQKVIRRRVSEPLGSLRYLLPFLTGDADGFALTYYATAKDGGMGTFRAAFSADGDAWGGAEAVHGPVLVTSKRGGLDWLGDYAGARLHDGALVAAFADNSSVPGQTLSHVRVARVERR
jgi:hypothetical protein